MTGRRLPLTWPGNLRKSSYASHRDTYSLLDAAALATTYPLNSVFHVPDLAPDFTALSFYKIFGFPDLGGLVVRKASGKILQWRKYFGGGTVSMVTVLGKKPWFASRETLHGSLEDGTLPLHNIIALGATIDTHKRLYGPNPMATICQHTNFLGKHLCNATSSLYHSTGIPVCQIYKGTSSMYGDSTTQGATTLFSVVHADGTYIPYTSIVEKLANERNIYVRAGQLCNPGGIATNLGFDTWHMKRLYAYGHRCGGAAEAGTEIVNGKPTGVVRVSLGAMTTIANVDSLITFLREEFMHLAPAIVNLPAQRQTNMLTIKNKDENPYSIGAETRFRRQRYSRGSLVGPPQFVPSQSWDSAVDTRIDVSFSTRIGRSSPSIVDNEK
jgi:molybdenum cofactor sulfurtransferase